MLPYMQPPEHQRRGSSDTISYRIWSIVRVVQNRDIFQIEQREESPVFRPRSTERANRLDAATREQLLIAPRLAQMPDLKHRSNLQRLLAGRALASPAK